MKGFGVLLFLLCTIFFLEACRPPEFDPLPPRERTYLRVLHANSSLGSVNLKLSSFEESIQVSSGIHFKESWPPTGYASLLTGASPDSTESNLAVVYMDVLGSNNKDTIIPGKALELLPERYSTHCLIDSFGKPIIVKTLDDIQPLKGLRANVRFMNLSNVAPSVSLRTNVDTVRVDRLNFLNYSKFSEVPSGIYNFYFVNDFTGAKLDSIKNFTVKPRKTYSFFLVQNRGVASGGVEILEQ